jgi:hypothetical protein
MPLFLAIHVHDLIYFIRRQEQLTQSVEVESTAGPWTWYLKNKGNSSTMQRFLVPWLIALHGIGFAKIPKNSAQISEMILALCTEHRFLLRETTMTPEKAAEQFPIAFQDVCEKARNAASKPILLTYHPHFIPRLYVSP